MSMSTSHRSALASVLRIGFLALVLGVDVACSAATTLGVNETIASQEESHQAEAALLGAFKEQDDLPDSVPLKPVIKNPLWWSASEGGKRLLVPVHIRYQGLKNSYCRFVTLSADLQTAELTPVPPQVNFDDCSEVATTLYFDINGDGVLDVIQGVRVKSNRYATTAVVPIVYLSSATAKSGYCYSEPATRQLQPADLGSIGRAQKALEDAKQRLGISQFECSQ